MNSKLKDKQMDILFNGILQIQTVEECYAFFEDLCTINELKALAQRFEVAQLLREKETYSDIVQKTGASSATVSRVNRALHYGADGYKMVLDRLDEIKKLK